MPTTTARLNSLVRRATPHGPATPASAEEREFAERAIATLNAVLANPEFAQDVLTAPYSSTLCLGPGNLEQRPTASEVLATIMSGVELGRPTTDHMLDLSIALADLPPGMSGSTLPRDTEVTTDTTFFTKCRLSDDVVSVAAAWMHEWMHLAGFIHESPPQGDVNDVPYTVQGIVERLASRPDGLDDNGGSTRISRTAIDLELAYHAD